MNRKKVFTENLLNWRIINDFDSEFLWRNSKDPYEIIISEMLLKKTTRVQVKNVWNIFIEIFPSFYSLVEADNEDIKKIIKPLGLENNRSSELHKMAKVIVDDYSGKVPNSLDKLLELPGVGQYVSNAVLCFAFHNDIAIVDRNVVRIICRVFSKCSIKARPRTDRNIWSFVQTLIPQGKGLDFNYSILDFTNIICTSKKPKCNSCKMADICDYNLKKGIWNKQYLK